LASSNEKQALVTLCGTSHWRSIIAFTFNLKQSISTPAGGYIIVDEFTAKAAFKRYMRQLNRSVYGAAFRHYGKRLRVIPILERSANRRWHYHVAMEPPLHMNNSSLAELAMTLWHTSDFGYEHGDAALSADANWIFYMAKLRTKSGFEHYFDCIDTESFFNPAVSA
jgi:hypothetical protein